MANDGAACGSGQRIGSDDGDVCVFRRDQPLVIEGGFMCPASFDHRIDTATAIACSASRSELLPPAACAMIEGPCDSRAPRLPSAASAPGQAAATDDGPDVGAPGECVRPCATEQDCPNDFFACDRGECVWAGCENDEECTASGRSAQVCRPVPQGGRNCVDRCDSADDCGPERDGLIRSACVDRGCIYWRECERDADCDSPTVCGGTNDGNECMFPCETVADCARNAQLELGLDAPDPNDPFTTEDAFVCLHGLCRGRLGCREDVDCTRYFGENDMVCQLSGS
jgi:hypothetical protein